MQNTEHENAKCESCERLRAALTQVRGFVRVMESHNWRDLRLHIARQCNVLNDEQSAHPQQIHDIAAKLPLGTKSK